MFQFSGFPPYHYRFMIRYMESVHVGFPIRRSTGQWICAPPRSFSQLVTSFFGSQCQGIHPALFLLNRSDLPSSVRASGFSMVLSIFLHNIKMLLRCLPIQRFILSNKSFFFGIRFLWCLYWSLPTQQALKELHLLFY